jgi:hypothetical protein
MLQVPGGPGRGDGATKGADDVWPARPTATWTARRPGSRSRRIRALRQPAPLLKKLDESVVEEEYARLEG